MDMVPVTSTNIAMVGYDAYSSEMHIQFNTGRVYAYFGVPEDLYQAFMNASSQGTFFHQHIRGRFGDTKIG